jgi:hypothetical protein
VSRFCNGTKRMRMPLTLSELLVGRPAHALSAKASQVSELRVAQLMC